MNLQDFQKQLFNSYQIIENKLTKDLYSYNQ